MSMQRNHTERRREPRRGAEREATQPAAGQPRDEEEDDLQNPEDIPSLLTAREFEARDPAKVDEDEKRESASERPGSTLRDKSR
jgi:hypothetical protein